jgi:hypothetical protein
LADRVLLKIVCLLMRWLFSLTVLVVRGDRAKNAELLVLRRENAVLRRNPRRVRYEPADRAWFAALTRFIPRRRQPGDAPNRRRAAGPARVAGVVFPGGEPAVLATVRGRCCTSVLYSGCRTPRHTKAVTALPDVRLPRPGGVGIIPQGTVSHRWRVSYRARGEHERSLQQPGQSRTRLERTVCQHDAMPPKFVTSPGGPRVATARTKLLVSVGAAIVGGTAAAVAGAGRAAPLIGWDILALVFGGWVWSTVWRLDAESP